MQIRESHRMDEGFTIKIHHVGKKNKRLDGVVDAIIVRMCDYDLSEILQKGLLFILPFYFVRYERAFNKQKPLPLNVITSIKNDYDFIEDRLDQMVNADEIDDSAKNYLIYGMYIVLYKLAKSHAKEIEEVFTKIRKCYYVNKGDIHLQKLVEEKKAAKAELEREKLSHEATEAALEQEKRLHEETRKENERQGSFIAAVEELVSGEPALRSFFAALKKTYGVGSPA